MEKVNANVCYAVSSPRAALAWTTLAFFAGFSGVSAFGPIVPHLKQAMDVGPLLMGILAASPALTGSLLRIPFGALVDRMGGKKPILIPPGTRVVCQDRALVVEGKKGKLSRTIHPAVDLTIGDGVVVYDFYCRNLADFETVFPRK